MAQAAAPDRLVSPSIDPDEVEKFSRIAGEWWDPASKFAPLHKFNPARLTWIREQLSAHYGRSGAAPLEGLTLLDIGCGGGLVSEPMARLGASVTGVDAAQANIKTAMVHAEETGLNIDYRWAWPSNCWSRTGRASLMWCSISKWSSTWPTRTPSCAIAHGW